MAKIMVRQAAPQAHDVHQLYALLAAGIDDPDGGARFVTEPQDRRSLGPHGAPVTRLGASAPEQRAHASCHARRAPRRRRARLDAAFVDAATSTAWRCTWADRQGARAKAAQRTTSDDEFLRLVADNLGTQERAAYLREMGAGEP
jgi:hypothetical protein